MLLDKKSLRRTKEKQKQINSNQSLDEIDNIFMANNDLENNSFKSDTKIVYTSGKINCLSDDEILKIGKRKLLDEPFSRKERATHRKIYTW